MTMNDPGFFYWGGTVFWALSGFVLGWVLGRHEMMLRAIREGKDG